MMELPGRWNSVWVVPAEIACDLESELNDAIRELYEARELLASEKITRNHIIEKGVAIEQQRDEAREQNAKLRDIAEMAIEYVGHTAVQEKLRAELDQLKEGAK
jgi:hypothetical protein